MGRYFENKPRKPRRKRKRYLENKPKAYYDVMKGGQRVRYFRNRKRAVGYAKAIGGTVR